MELGTRLFKKLRSRYSCIKIQILVLKKVLITAGNLCLFILEPPPCSLVISTAYNICSCHWKEEPGLYYRAAQSWYWSVLTWGVNLWNTRAQTHPLRYSRTSCSVMRASWNRNNLLPFPMENLRLAGTKQWFWCHQALLFRTGWGNNVGYLLLFPTWRELTVVCKGCSAMFLRCVAENRQCCISSIVVENYPVGARSSRLLRTLPSKLHELR